MIKFRRILNIMSQKSNSFSSKNRKNSSSIPMKILTSYTAAAIILFGMAGCGKPNFDKSEAEYMEQNINRIKVGMTKQDLSDLLGKPNEYIPRSHFIYNGEGVVRATNWLYVYPDNNFSHNVYFDCTDRITKSEKESTRSFKLF